MTGATYRGWDTRNGWDYNYLDVHGIEGGKLDLSGLETITSGATVIYADGNNSVVDLSIAVPVHKRYILNAEKLN
jgi:hypothetical protein